MVCACYAIGLGAVLTPVGEPLSTIMAAKLSGPPHNAGFFFLAQLLGGWVTPAILAVGWFAVRKLPAKETGAEDSLRVPQTGHRDDPARGSGIES